MEGVIDDFHSTDAGVFSELTLEVRSGKLWWASMGGAAGYDVVRGSLTMGWSTQWDYDTAGVMQGCLANDRPETFWDTADSPAPGDGVFYLVRPQPGSYDTGSSSQQESRDAEIGASGNACP